jgi:hypothetical protein
MERTELITNLLRMPEQIAQAEERFLKAQERLRDARACLEDRRAELLTKTRVDGTAYLTGKNAEQREAQLHEETAGERIAVERAEAEAGKERIYLERARHEFAAYRSVARLLGGEERLAA